MPGRLTSSMYSLLLISCCSAMAIHNPSWSAKDLGMPQSRNAIPKKQLDRAFHAWKIKQTPEVRLQTLVQREVNRIPHPDIPIRLVFDGVAESTTISGSATTDALRLEAVRLHNLDAELQQLKFYVNGMKLPAGTAISESVLADTKDVEVTVVGKQRVVTNEGPNPGWSGRQFTGSRSAGGRQFSDGSAADGANTWWGEAGTMSGSRR